MPNRNQVRLESCLRSLFVSLGVVGMLGCASMSSTPGWVNGDMPAEYPKNRFVSALSTGESLDAAKSAAKAELSRVFSADLKSEIKLIDEEVIQGDQSVQGSIFESDTTISTDVELQGVEVPLHWRDPKSGEIWALATLERRKECLRIRTEGADLITELDALSRDVQSSTNPLLAIRSAVQGVSLGVALDQLQARSRVLGNQCLEGRSISTGELRAEAARRMRALSFVVTTEEIDSRSGRSTGSLPQLREKIAGNLTRMGFQVGPAAGAKVIPIVARLRLSRVERGTDWVEIRWEGSAEIGSPNPEEAAILVAESEGAESHPAPSTARLRSRRKGEQDLARKLDQRLEAFLAGDEEAP